MLTWDLFRHYLFSRRAGALVRTVAWLCIVGVGIGVMALVVVLSIMNGFNDAMKDRLLAVEPHLIVNIPGTSTYEDVHKNPIYSYLAAQSGVQARILESQEIIVRTADSFFGGALARGVEPESLHTILNEVKRAMNKNRKKGSTEVFEPVQTPTEEGRADRPGEIQLGPGEVLIGVDLARSLAVFPGEKLTVIAPEALLLPAGEAPDFERVTIKGFLVTNIADIDSKMIFYPRATTFRHLADSSSREIGIEVRLPDADDYGTIKKELEAKGAKVTTWIDRNSSLFYALRMEKFAMGMFLGLSALIASFSIVTVLVLLLTQKRRDIGVLMSMGLSTAKTRRVFIQLGLLLSGIGLGGGLIAGTVICLVISTFPMNILPSIYYDTTIPARLDPYLIFCVVIVAAVVSVLSAYFPARRHTQMLPAEALRAHTGAD